jgi:hypothetical protein
MFSWVYRKHYKTPWKPVPICFNTLSKKIQLIPLDVFKKSISNGRKLTGRSSLYVKTSDFHFENRNENLEGSHWKSENRPTLFSTCVCIRASPALLCRWHEEFFSQSKFNFYSFATPPIKLKLKHQIGGRPLIANHMDQSLWWANLLNSSEIIFNPIVSACTLHQPGQATCLIV